MASAGIVLMEAIHNSCETKSSKRMKESSAEFIFSLKFGESSRSLNRVKYHKMRGVKIFTKNQVCLQKSPNFL